VEKEIIMTYPQTQTATKPEDPIHVGLPQLVFCALLSCTLHCGLALKGTVLQAAWPFTVSYLGAHPVIYPTC